MLIRSLTLFVVATATACSNANAQNNHSSQAAVEASPTKGPHGGTIQNVGLLQVETVVGTDGLRLFAYDQQGAPLDLRAARGIATLQIAGNPKRYRYDLFPELRKNKTAESLSAVVDLSQIAGQQIDLAIQVVGVPQGEQRPAEIAASLIVPASDKQQVAAAIQAQDVCPVSGQPLGSMGDPIAVSVGNETLYVCCSGCIDTVKEHPEKYFTAKPTLTVTPATEADAAAIAAQKLCPVMDEPLGGMGTPLKVSGLERDVFLCCKGCLTSLEKDPQKYLAKLPPSSETR